MSEVVVKVTILTKLLEKHILEPFMGNKLHPGVEDGEDVVSILVARVSCLQEHLHLPQVLTLLQQRDSIVLTPRKGCTNIEIIMQMHKMLLRIQYSMCKMNAYKSFSGYNG